MKKRMKGIYFQEILTKTESDMKKIIDIKLMTQSR